MTYRPHFPHQLQDASITDAAPFNALATSRGTASSTPLGMVSRLMARSVLTRQARIEPGLSDFGPRCARNSASPRVKSRIMRPDIAEPSHVSGVRHKLSRSGNQFRVKRVVNLNWRLIAALLANIVLWYLVSASILALIARR